MTKVIVTCNQKGGVGKTTTAVNIAAFFSIFGKKTLLIDFDPQGNASSGVGVDVSKLDKCIYNCLIDGENIKNIIIKTRTNNLDLAPSTQRLAGADVELVNIENRENRLKETIKGIKSSYDYIIIDSPPSLSLLTINALVAADEVIIPVQCEYYALEGLSNLMNTLELVRLNLNTNLRVKGIVLTMFDSRTLLSKQVVDEARDHFNEKVFETVIPRNVRLSEAPSFGEPIIYYDPTSSGAVAYESLSKELLNG